MDSVERYVVAVGEMEVFNSACMFCEEENGVVREFVHSDDRYSLQ
jgi:hypothetical protein